MNNFLEILKIIGAIAGLAALIWKIYEEMAGYLKIKVSVSNENNIISLLTEVKNKSNWSKKKLTNAFIIVSPEEEDIIESGKKISQNLSITREINHTNDFTHLTSKKPVYINKQLAFIPLDFYYSENVRFGDEQLTYRCSVDHTQLNKGKYSVRFYIFNKNRLHRSTQDLLIIN